MLPNCHIYFLPRVLKFLFPMRKWPNQSSNFCYLNRVIRCVSMTHRYDIWYHNWKSCHRQQFHLIFETIGSSKSALNKIVTRFKGIVVAFSRYPVNLLTTLHRRLYVNKLNVHVFSMDQSNRERTQYPSNVFLRNDVIFSLIYAPFEQISPFI